MTEPPPRTVAVARLGAREAADDALDAAARHALVDVGGAPIEPATTEVMLAADDDALLVRFDCRAEPPLAIAARRAHDAVYEDECVEIFLADPDDPARYRELVVNPRGVAYGARVHNPDGSRATWTLERAVSHAGVEIAVSGTPGERPEAWTAWRCTVRWPWASASESGRAPSQGSARRGNLYRIARGRLTRFEALSATLRSAPPDFHVPERFARFLF